MLNVNHKFFNVETFNLFKGGQDSYKKYNLAPKNQKNKDFNVGHLAKLHLTNLKCPCGIFFSL